ncbi:hypothetical protein BDA99DRAFT_563963 [Phascolomyces articulosus]|uniref:Uncharacterized protein n=1 Tax=Phascolomyces articulosus TaxID=60185 RepID=A0AAD5JQY2_9FUNG|nr:hypothetical protein BDA99DRAFT_563963 [Phascolomyces articulosus]
MQSSLRCIAPTQAIGYLRLGQLFSMQGKQHNKHRSAALVRVFQDYASPPPKEQKLHDVKFENLPSAKILKEFLGKTRVVSVNFTRIPQVVDDDILNQLVHTEQLEELSLNEIHKITEEGVINLVDHSKTLHTLEITSCRYIYDDTEASSYIISKIKNIVICWDQNCVYDI